MSLSPARSRTAPSAETRDALMHAAGEVFAEVGFHAATVRTICRRAGANVAAVNYHFGDKETLYVEVLRRAMARAHARHPFDGGSDAGAPPEERLHGFVRNFLGRLFEPGEHAWLGRLMAQEMIAPSHALDLMVAERIRPMADQLRDIIRPIAGPDCSEAELRLCGFSIVSQCLFYNHCRSVVRRLFPDQPFTPGAVEALAGHITRFSLAGLKDRAQLPRRRATPPRRRRVLPLGLLTLLLVSVGVSAPVHAADEPPTVTTNRLPGLDRPLSLEDCLNTALDQNPEVQKSRKDLEIAHGLSIQTRAIVLPKLRASGDYVLRSDAAVDKLEIPPGVLLPEGMAVIDPGQENWSTGVRLVQSIFEGGRMRSSLKTARLLREQALAAHQVVLADTATDVRVGFYNVLLTEQEITVSLASVDLLENELADSQRRFNAGTVPRFNVLRAEVELANARPRVSRARNSYRIAKNLLVNQLGYRVPQDVWEDIPLSLAGTLDAPKFEITVPDAVRLALERRPELVALRHAEALRREGVTVARAGYLPRLEGFAGYGARKSVFTPDLGDYVHGWEAGVQAVWDIFDGAQTRGKVTEARARLERAQIETDDVTRDIELEVRTAYSTLVEAWEVMESQQKTVEQAEEALRLARSRADAGAGTQLDVLGAQTALTEARTTNIRAKREYAVALARLERAIGAVTPATRSAAR